ncbi:hypothetical protein, partial [Aureimonas sp. Leaf460]|uniref:flagellin n=2 Tax=unclassified Aureimonas TaxID=2615206 RepID=UPI0009E8C7A2
MVSINTTYNGIAVAALRRVNSDLQTTQSRIATGYRVNSAKDDPSVWAAASTLRSDAAASDNLKNTLTTAKAQADAGIAAIDGVSEVLQKVSDIVVAANAAGAATAQQVADVGVYITQITALVAGASLNGKNVLVTANNLSASTVVVNGATVGALAYTSASLVAQTNIALVMGATDATKVLALNGKIALAQGEASATASALGSFSSGAETMLSFSEKLTDIRNSAISGMVDADLEKESAKLQAL